MLVDSHHHFWDPSRRSYPWLGEALAPINRRFGIEDLEPVLRECGVAATILVQTVSSLDETKEFLALAASTEFIAGVVGWVDLTAPSVDDDLARLLESSSGAKLVAIRHQVEDEPDPDWLLRPEVQRGIAAVGGAGLVYDLLVRPRNLRAAVETVRELGGVRFIVDHAAKPNIADGRNEVWRDGTRALASSENVACKVSGMMTEAAAPWRVEDIRPYVLELVEWFGPERLLFGSDWPVSLLVGSYRETLDGYRQMLDSLPAEQLAEIFGSSAVRWYGLDQAPAGALS